MKKMFLCLFGGFMVTLSVAAQDKAIKVSEDGKSWQIYTRSSVYRLAVNAANGVQAFHYGNKLLSENPEPVGVGWSYAALKTEGSVGAEVPVRGAYVASLPVLEAIFPDGVRDIELEYKSYQIMDIDGYPALKIVQRDNYYPLEVSSFIRVLPEYDMIEKWVEVTNTGTKGAVKIENLLSGSVFLPKDIYELTHYSGVWSHELAPQTTKLTKGTKTIQVRDFKSYGSSTFMVRPEGENDPCAGKVWFGSVVYSGNWRVDFEKFNNGNLQIVGGMNFWDQEVYLKPKQTMTSPHIMFGYTEQGADGVTMNIVSYTREKLLPATHRDRLRPVLYNSWFATGIEDVNEAHQLAMVQIAKEIGVELFMLDDGWFRVTENGSADADLGDWKMATNRFPNGLTHFINKVNEAGMDFGIWIEPEMVNPNSDLYRAHPDWVFHYPNRKRHPGRLEGGRNQLMLNLAREDVYQHQYKCFYNLLKDNNIKYIKWDMNKVMTDPGYMAAPADEQRAVRIKYMENFYRLIEALRKDFPDVWFENCSSGAGRADLAMASRFDFTWVSDNTDPVDRIFMQDSYLALFPANTMINWTTKEDLHQQKPSLEYKFDVSMCGVLGVGHDIAIWSDEEKKLAAKKITQYKQIREIVQKGDAFRLVSPFNENRSVLQFVDKSKMNAVIFAYNLAEYLPNQVRETQQSPLVKLRGLQPDVRYSIEWMKETYTGRDQMELGLQPDEHYRIEGMKETYTGRYLMEIGLIIPLRGAYKSKIYKVQAVK